MATKARFFTFLVYPDSAPDDWRDQLSDSLRMFLISPLHEPDKLKGDEPEDEAIGHQRKAHWHVLYCHGNTISPNSARKVLKDEFPWAVITPNNNRFAVGAACNLARYFLHLDQPEKQQFQGDPYELLVPLNGYPLDLSRQLTNSQKRQMRINIQSFCQSQGIMEYAELCDVLRGTQDWEMYDYVNDNYGWTNAYLASRRAVQTWRDKVAQGDTEE